METPVQKPISELSEALEALGTDKLLIQTANGTKIIQASILAPALLSLLVGDSAARHNAIYRGKCLGSSFTAAQSATRAHPATAAPNTGDAAITQLATSKARQAPRTSESKASDVEA